jgi:hypothetical protein
VVLSVDRSPNDGLGRNAMPVSTSGVALLFAAMAAALAIAAAPVAGADPPCDPAVVACDTPGNVDSPGNVEINDSPPPVSAADEQYPFDNDWYFNPAGGGTALQPNHPSGGGGGGGGGGHR